MSTNSALGNSPASPWFCGQYDDKPQSGDRFLATLSPLRGSIQNDTYPRACARG